MLKFSAAFFAVLLAFAAGSGCEPFENAEQLFPLPAGVWDRAVPVKNFQAFEIKSLHPQEFINLKAALLADGCKEKNLDFFFAGKAGETPMKASSKDIILLLAPISAENKLHRAAAYFLRENKLIIGLGVPETN